jgi:asparagine synthase (glutamine-hydrolysing)
VLAKGFLSAWWTAYQRGRMGFGSARNDLMVNPAYLADLLARGVVQAERPAKQIPLTEMRARIAATLQSVANAAMPGQAGPAGAHGLDFTRPFHDRRIVEFGLAVPEDLYVRAGRNRYLAFTAMRDVIPPEFRRRGRANNAMTPNIPALLDEMLPELRAEAARMRPDPRLGRYLNFDAIDKALEGSALDNKPRRIAGIVLATRGLAMGRYLEWFDRRNAG